MVVSSEEYETLFTDAAGHKAIGEASTAYLPHPEVPMRINESSIPRSSLLARALDRLSPRGSGGVAVPAVGRVLRAWNRHPMRLGRKRTADARRSLPTGYPRTAGASRPEPVRLAAKLIAHTGRLGHVRLTETIRERPGSSLVTPYSPSAASMVFRLSAITTNWVSLESFRVSRWMFASSSGVSTSSSRQKGLGR